MLEKGEKVIRAQKGELLLEAIRGATIFIPDGIGIVVAARFLRGSRIKRVAGSDLMAVLVYMPLAKATGSIFSVPHLN